MKKLFFFLCLLGFYSCAGYEPILSSKNLSFYIGEIININNDRITKSVSKNLNNNKLKINNKQKYILKITSNKEDVITSKDSNGNALTFEIIITVNVDVFVDDSDKSISTLKFNKTFSYNNQKNNLNMSRYKKTIEENIINKISQDLVVELQAL